MERDDAIVTLHSQVRGSTGSLEDHWSTRRRFPTLVRQGEGYRKGTYGW